MLGTSRIHNTANTSAAPGLFGWLVYLERGQLRVREALHVLPVPLRGAGRHAARAPGAGVQEGGGVADDALVGDGVGEKGAVAPVRAEVAVGLCWVGGIGKRL